MANIAQDQRDTPEEVDQLRQSIKKHKRDDHYPT